MAQAGCNPEVIFTAQMPLGRGFLNHRLVTDKLANKIKRILGEGLFEGEPYILIGLFGWLI